MLRVCSMNGEERNACGIFVGEPERNRPLRNPRTGRIISKIVLEK
jgi:hypothetical protein